MKRMREASAARGALGALVVLAAVLASGCASAAHDSAKAGTQGSIEAVREMRDPVLTGLHADVARDPSVRGIARGATDGVIDAVAARAARLEAKDIARPIDVVGDGLVRLAARLEREAAPSLARAGTHVLREWARAAADALPPLLDAVTRSALAATEALLRTATATVAHTTTDLAHLAARETTEGVVEALERSGAIDRALERAVQSSDRLGERVTEGVLRAWDRDIQRLPGRWSGRLGDALHLPTGTADAIGTPTSTMLLAGAALVFACACLLGVWLHHRRAMAARRPGGDGSAAPPPRP